MTDTALNPQTLTGAYVIDPAHSTFAFVARHAMVTKVRGLSAVSVISVYLLHWLGLQ